MSNNILTNLISKSSKFKYTVFVLLIFILAVYIVELYSGRDYLPESQLIEDSIASRIHSFGSNHQDRMLTLERPSRRYKFIVWPDVNLEDSSRLVNAISMGDSVFKQPGSRILHVIRDKEWEKWECSWHIGLPPGFKQ